MHEVILHNANIHFVSTTSSNFTVDKGSDWWYLHKEWNWNYYRNYYQRNRSCGRDLSIMFLHTCMWFPKLFEMVQLWGSCSPKPSNHWRGIIPNCRCFEIPWKESNWHDYYLRPFYSIDLYCIHLNSAFTSLSSACFKWTTSSCLIKYRPRSTKAWRKEITVEQQKIEQTATWSANFSFWWMWMSGTVTNVRGEERSTQHIRY